MRVVCDTMDGFIANLAHQMDDEDQSVVRSAVYLSVTRRGLDDQDLRKAAKIVIGIHASAVINIIDGQFLLDYGEDCGVDYHDGTGESGGSARVNQLREQLNLFCKQAKLYLLPGIVDAS